MENKILLCFTDGIDNKFRDYLEKISESGFEVHLYDNISEIQFKPHNILNILEPDWKMSSIYFASNIEKFFKLVYRLYHQSFDGFFYYEDDTAKYNVDLEDIYKMLLAMPFNSKENLYKPILTNMNADFNPASPEKSKIQKYYYLHGKYYLFEPFNGKKEIIFLEQGDCKFNFKNLILYYDNSKLEKAMDIFQRLDSSLKYFYKEYSDIENILKELKLTINSSNELVRLFYIRSLELASENFGIYVKIFILSFLINIKHNAEYINNILCIALENSVINRESKFFILFQCARVLFVNNGLGDEQTSILIRKLYRTIYEQFNSQFSSECKFIPKEHRDRELVLVLTNQFISLNHGPTKTTLDRCRSLTNHLHKKVMLINTKEMMTLRGAVPFYNMVHGSIIKDYDKIHSMPYKDIEVPFYQPNCLMPADNEINNILNIIKEYKPYFILNIGGESVVADICSKIVPVMVVSTVPSGLPLTESQFHDIGRKLTDGDLNYLNMFGFTKDNIIESVFTFDFKPQQHTYSKKEFNLPENKFLLAVVGARLNDEVTDSFIRMLVNTINQYNTHVVFLGYFDKYDKYSEADETFSKNSTYLGFQEDVLGILELCDLYVNPLRAGGATSAVEAMYKGVPAVTFSSGDVSIATKKDFWVNSYDEMYELIGKYSEDKVFYRKMSAKAKERALILMDTDAQLENAINYIEKSKLF